MQLSLSLLGSTGSIGQSTLNVLRQHPDKFRVKVLVGGANWQQMAKDVQEFSPEVVYLKSEQALLSLKNALGAERPRLVSGSAGLTEASCEDVDICVSAITGFAGLAPTMNAIRHSKRLCLANKESLVCGGWLLKSEAQKYGTQIVPIDSEHSAIFQCLHQQPRSSLEKIVLTASGGPFRTWNISDINAATAKQALSHPNWDMGVRVTINSASLMNKALEYIEALHLFDLEPEKIQVLVHPQSIIHSMVHFNDGSYLAQLGVPDMRSPIAYALSYPDRIETSVPGLDFDQVSSLDFVAPDLAKFPIMGLAPQVFKAGPSACVAFNALDEVAVSSFVKGTISFGQMVSVVLDGMQRLEAFDCDSLEAISACDASARHLAEHLITQA